MEIIMKTYLRHKIENVVDIKELMALEYLDFEGRYKNYEEKHGFWELCYVEAGQISLYLDGKYNQLSEKELIVIPPNTTHSYGSENGNVNRAFVICFESQSHSLRSLCGECFSLDSEHIRCIKTIISESNNTFFMNENDLLEVVSSPNFGGQQAILSQLIYLLISLIRQLSTKKDSELVFLSEGEFYADLVDVIIRFFREKLTEKLTLSDICERVNYSPSFLCKKFKEQTGETLFTCFNRLKIEEARRLLCETSLSVTEIAKMLGFSELKYFGSLFKRITGYSPSNYRAKERE